MSQSKIVSKANLKSNSMKAVKVDGKPILLVNLDGAYYAIGNICTHMECPLSSGTLKGENIECLCHGAMFNVKTGEVVRGPAEKSQPTYNVKVENGQVVVSI
jgi:3-phenylpropionate/trans-cinnamate dioxygenase ferredoxin subunit